MDKQLREILKIVFQMKYKEDEFQQAKLMALDDVYANRLGMMKNVLALDFAASMARCIKLIQRDSKK